MLLIVANLPDFQDEIADFVGTILLAPPGHNVAPAPTSSPVVVRSDNRAKMKFVEKKRKLSGSDDMGSSPRKSRKYFDLVFSCVRKRASKD